VTVTPDWIGGLPAFHVRRKGGSRIKNSHQSGTLTGTLPGMTKGRALQEVGASRNSCYWPRPGVGNETGSSTMKTLMLIPLPALLAISPVQSKTHQAALKWMDGAPGLPSGSQF